MNLYSKHSNPETLYGYEEALGVDELFDDDTLIELGFASSATREILARLRPDTFPTESWTAYLPFVSDELLDELLADMKNLALEFVFEQTAEWEINDVGFLDYLTDEGIVDDEGNIDWENAPSYAEYNDDVNAMHSVLSDTFDITRDDLINAAQRLNVEDGDYDATFEPHLYSVANLDYIFSFILREDLPSRTNNYDAIDYVKHSIAEYILERIGIRRIFGDERHTAVVENGQIMHKVEYIKANEYDRYGRRIK